MEKSIKFKHLLLSNLILIILIFSGLLGYRVIASPDNSPAAPNMSMDVLSYQGTLVDSSGNPVTGDQDITFRIYNHATDPTPLWEEAHTGTNAVPVQNGLFNVMLGSLNPIPDSVWDEAELFLGIQIGTEDEMTPREVINLLPPQIAPGSLDASVLKPNSMGHEPFYTYQFNYGSEIRFVNFTTNETSTLDPTICEVNNNWCCNSADTICITRNSSGDDKLVLRMEDSHSSSCWLVHSDDDFPEHSSDISYSTDHDGTDSPFADDGNVFYFMRPGVNDIAINRWSQYLILCLK
jgi:hypothetical protein